MSKIKKMEYINFVAFLFGWIIVFLLGADFPPPVGFNFVVFLIIALDFIQLYYFKLYFKVRIDKDKKIKLFLMNNLFFLIGSFIVSIITVIPNANVIEVYNVFIWVAIVTTVGVLYGILFFAFNVLLFRVIKDKNERNGN